MAKKNMQKCSKLLVTKEAQMQVETSSGHAALPLEWLKRNCRQHQTLA